MKIKQNRLNHFNILLLIALVVFAGIGFCAYKKKDVSNPFKLFSTAPNTLQISQFDISDWQTYSNPKYAYTIKYPKNWYQTADINGNPFFWPSQSSRNHESLSIKTSKTSFDDSNIQIKPFKELHYGDYYFWIYINSGNDDAYLSVLEQIALTFKYEETDIFRVSRLPLPQGLEINQIQTPQKINNYFFVPFIKSSFNLPVSSPVQRSGVLYLKPEGPKWELFFEIADLNNDSSSKNNPYMFWQEDGHYYAVIVDTGGAGSGEGIGKLIKINPQLQDWETVKCFQFNPSSFFKHIDSFEDISKSQRVISYASGSPFEDYLPAQFVYDKNLKSFTLNGQVFPHCTNFSLKVY